MPYGGIQLKPRYVARIMYDAGWTDVMNLMKMVSVAIAESSLYTEAYNVNRDGSTDWGYLQLNDGGLEGEPLRVFKAIAFDPVGATEKARSMYRSRGFQPWVAYNTGSWEQHIDRASLGICNFIREKYGIPTV